MQECKRLKEVAKKFPSTRSFWLRSLVMAGMHGRAATLDLGRQGRNGTHTRQRSDIDSLSPEVVAALQSTFGGKLNELRSQASLQTQEPERKPFPLQPPLQEAKEVKDAVESENEGAFLAIAYIAGILASISVLVTPGGKLEENVSCKGLGDSKCVRLYGYILPIVVTGISLILALVLSVFDVSFGVYNVLKTTESFFVADTFGLSNVPQMALSYIIDLGFVAIATSLLWVAKASTVDPLFTFCEEGIKVFWTFGLMAMGTVIFWCAAKSIINPVCTQLSMKRAAKIVTGLLLFFGASSLVYNIVTPPQLSRPCQPPVAAGNNGTENTQLQLYYKGWLYEIPDPEPKQLQLYSEAHQYGWCSVDSLSCPVRKSLPQCELRAKPDVREARDDNLEMCEARYDRGMCKARYDQGTCNPRSDEGFCLPRWSNEMCKAIDWEECEWPWLKRMEVYESMDKCKYTLPVCDWPLVKRIQIYESKQTCKYDCPSCDWPLVKRIQVYSRVDRCGTLTLATCDWQYLKQIQRYKAKELCYLDDRPQCEWPFLKQVQSYEPWDFCTALHYKKCDSLGNSVRPIYVVTNLPHRPRDEDAETGSSIGRHSLSS